MTRCLVNPLRRVRRLSCRLRPQQGNSLIEMALILPVFFLIVFGVIDFSLVLFGMGNADYASRAALRYATLHSSTSYSATTQQDLNRIVSPYIFNVPANTWSVVPRYPSGNVVGSGVTVTVTITYNLKILGYSYNPISYSTTGMGNIQQ